MHYFFLVFISKVLPTDMLVVWTRFSHDSGVMILHLKIGSSGKKSLVKCSRTASIMSNFTTWHCVKDEMGKEGSIAQVFTAWHRYRKQNFTDRQVFKWSSVQVLKFIDKKRLKCSSVQVPPQSCMTTLWYFHGPTRSQPINKILHPFI